MLFLINASYRGKCLDFLRIDDILNIIGVVYSDFIVPSVPRGKFDISLGILLTEKGVVVTGEN